MPGLIRFIGFVGSDLTAPGICADRRNLILLDPVAGFKSETGRIPTAVTSPVVSSEASLLMAGSDDKKIGCAYLNALRLCRSVKIVVGNGISIIQ